MGSFDPLICARALQAQGHSHPGRRVATRSHPQAGETFMLDPIARRTVLAALLAMAAASSAGTSLAQSSRLTLRSGLRGFGRGRGLVAYRKRPTIG
jgi:hypothetical protein